MKKILLIVILFCSYLSTLAHVGQHQNNQMSSKTWYFQDKTKATEGYFLFTKDNQVFIENKAGLVQSFEINKLSWMDKNYVNRRIAEIENLNKKITSFPQKSNSDYTFIYFLSLALALFLLKKSNLLPYFKYGFVLLACVFYACKKDAVDASTSTTTTTSTKTDPAFIESTFMPFKASLKTRYDDTYYYVESEGIPGHNMMVGITNWQQQVPIPQGYTGTNAWSIPLKPELATTPLSLKSNFMKGAVAIAPNGVPIFNPLNNRGEDAFAIGELDQWGGHCGKADDYHYHIAPLHFEATAGNNPIAMALDGFAIFGSKEPDATTMQTLDEYNGHTFKNVYHYHATTKYPYFIGSMRGKVSIDAATIAPENQITPQAKMTPIRPAGEPLKGASITNFKTTGTNAYSLEYTLNNLKGYINYNWDMAGNYTYTFIGTDGKSSTAKYTKK